METHDACRQQIFDLQLTQNEMSELDVVGKDVRTLGLALSVIAAGPSVLHLYIPPFHQGLPFMASALGRCSRVVAAHECMTS